MWRRCGTTRRGTTRRRATHPKSEAPLAAAYEPDADPLVLVTGDGDFGLLAARHPGPVLVVGGSPSGRLRDAGTVVDPATEGTAPIRGWLAAVGISGA